MSEADALKRVYQTVARSSCPPSAASSLVVPPIEKQSTALRGMPNEKSTFSSSVARGASLSVETKKAVPTSDPAPPIMQARRTPPPSPARSSLRESDEDDEETLISIARKVRKSVLEIRELNPHIAGFGDTEPLPPGTRLVFKKQKRASASTSDNESITQARRSEAHQPLPSSMATGLTIRRIGAKLRKTRSEIVSSAPQLSSYDLDDELPFSALNGARVGDVLLIDFLPASERPPRQHGASQPGRSLEGTAPRVLASPRSQPPSTPTRSFDASPATVREGESRQPLSPLSAGSRAQHTGGESESTLSKKRRELSRVHRVNIRNVPPSKIFVTPYHCDSSQYTLRSVARHVARCTIDDLLDMNPELETIFGIDDPLPPGTAVSVPQSAVIPRNEIPDEDDFGRRSSLGSSFAYTPRGGAHPSSSRTELLLGGPPHRHADDENADEDEYMECVSYPAAPSVHSFESRASARRVEHEAAHLKSPRGGVKNVKLSQAVRPSDAVGHTLAAIAWSLGLTVDELRDENPELNRFSSHEVLPGGTALFVPATADAATQKQQIDDFSAQRATAMRSRDHREDPPSSFANHAETRLQQQTHMRNGVSEERPKYRRVTSRSPSSRRGGSTLADGSVSGAPSSFEEVAASFAGLRTASSSLTESDMMSTNIRRFVVTKPNVTVQSIAQHFNVHPDVVYDLNQAELVECPDGVYHYQQPLPLGLLLQLPPPQR